MSEEALEASAESKLSEECRINLYLIYIGGYNVIYLTWIKCISGASNGVTNLVKLKQLVERMKSSKTKPLCDDWGFLKTKYLVLFTLLYNALGIFLFYQFSGHEAGASLLCCSLGYTVLIVVLVLRLSSCVREVVVKPERNNRELLSMLRFPIVLWSVLPTVLLFFPVPL